MEERQWANIPEPEKAHPRKLKGYVRCPINGYTKMCGECMWLVIDGSGEKVCAVAAMAEGFGRPVNHYDTETGEDE